MFIYISDITRAFATALSIMMFVHARDKFCVPITVRFQGKGHARLHHTMCNFLHPKTSREL